MISHSACYTLHMTLVCPSASVQEAREPQVDGGQQLRIGQRA
jgi:hypothetical protein